MGYTIRPVNVEDAELIAQLLNSIIDTERYTVMEGPMTAEKLLSYMQASPDQRIFNVAISDDDGRVLGTQSIDPHPTGLAAFRHVGDISTFISFDAHRMGIGQNLSQRTFKEAKARGYKKITAMIRADNPGAIAFYLNQGFNVIGTAQNHALVRGKYVDEVFTEKILDPK